MQSGREIKFRGRHIETGEFVYGYLIGDDVIVGKIVEWDSEYFNTEFWYKVDPETVGQYTGLRDKNGKEIYEGDILPFEPPFICERLVGEVVWGEGEFALAVDQEIACSLNDLIFNGIVDTEVIGNIYKNPELLEVGK